MSHELNRLPAVWGCCRIKQVITIKVPGTVCEYKGGCFFSPLLTPRKMNLQLLMGRGAASPHLKPLSGLAICLLMCHHRHCLPREMILWLRWLISMGVRLGRVLPDGPVSVLQAGVSHSIAIPDSASFYTLHKQCHKQEIHSCSQIHRQR